MSQSSLSFKDMAFASEMTNFENKSKLLDELKAFQVSDDRDKDIKDIKAFIDKWRSIGRVPFSKKNINGKFNKILDAIFKKLNLSHQESELLKYGNKIQQLAKADDQTAIRNERTFIRRKIDESKNDIRQLENNLQFFSDTSEDNPLVKEVIKNINRHKESLATWNSKLKKLNILEHNLQKGDPISGEVEEKTAEEE